MLFDNHAEPSDSAGKILVLSDITSERGGNCVLRSVRFEISPRECVAILGANGAGKSTLLRICAGLLRPSAGTVTILGSRLEPDRRRHLRQFGLVFQKHQLVPRISVLSNVVQGRIGFPEGWRCCSQITAPQSVRERAMACLEDVGLVHKATQQAKTLSGGESQRVAIARVLIREPALILADEPTASLDPSAGEGVFQLLRHVSRKHKTAVLMATHDMERALRYADRIIGLQDGEVIIDARSADLTTKQLELLYYRERTLNGGPHAG